MNTKPPNKTHTPHTTQRLVFSSEERPHEPRLNYIQTNMYIHTHTHMHTYLATYIYTYRWGREWGEIQREGLGPGVGGVSGLPKPSQAKLSLAVHQCALVHKICRWSPRSKGCWLQPQVYQVKGAWSLRGTTGTTTHVTLASFFPQYLIPLSYIYASPP